MPQSLSQPPRRMLRKQGSIDAPTEQMPFRHALPCGLRRHSDACHGVTMAKGEQRSNKMAKKPKKDSSTTSKPSVSDRPMPPTTTVIPRGKVKDK